MSRNSWKWKKKTSKELKVTVNQILLKFYRLTWHWKLIFCIEEKSCICKLWLTVISPPLPRALWSFFQCYSYPLYLHLIFFIFYFFFFQMKILIILSLGRPGNWHLEEGPFMDMRTCSPGELKNKPPEQGFEFSSLTKKRWYYLLLEKTFLCRPESGGSRKPSDY